MENGIREMVSAHHAGVVGVGVGCINVKIIIATDVTSVKIAIGVKNRRNDILSARVQLWTV